MVESGPYIEFRCQPYVQLAYVKSWILWGLLLIAVIHVLVALIRRYRRR